MVVKTKDRSALFVGLPIVACVLALFVVASTDRVTAGAAQQPTQGDLSTLAGESQFVASHGMIDAEFQIVVEELTRDEIEAQNIAIRTQQNVFRANDPPALVPVPQGHTSRPASAASETPADSGFGAQTTPNAIGDFGVLLQHDITAGEVSTGQRSTVMEPTAVTVGNAVFYTANWFAAKSVNNGSTFTYINPYTFFPSVNGGFCCDQVTAYAPTQNMALWGLQYVKDGSTNTFRIARAIGSAGIASNTWTYWSVTPASFGFPAGTWLDYPSMTVGTTYVYLSSNAFSVSGNSFVGNVVYRIPLAELAAGGAISYSYYKSGIGTERFAEGAGATMYWAGFSTTTQMRIFRWPDGINSIFSTDVNLNAFNWLNRDGVATSPDGTNWAARADSRPTGAYVANGVIGVMWTAKQGAGRPYPYTVHARFSEATRALITQADIFSTTHAWMYPSVMPNADGDLGGTMQVGGAASGTFAYPGTQAWITDAITGPSNTVGAVLTVSSSNDGPDANNWGDYFSTRRDATDPTVWVGASHTLQGGGSGANAVPKFFTFGRGTNVDVKAAITSPAPGTTLGGTSATFDWSAGSGALQYWLYVGMSGAGSHDVFSKDMGLLLTRWVSGLPADGGPVNVRLWTRFASGWQYTDYIYTAVAGLKAAMVSPTPGSTLVAASETFNWSAGASALQYWLYVGISGVGSHDVFSKDMGLLQARWVSGLPVNSSTIYVRLWTRLTTGWEYADYTYTAAPGIKAAMLSPAPGSTMSGTSATFDWSAGTNALQYWLYVGTNGAGSHDLFSKDMGLLLTRWVSGLPANGSTIYVRLWTRFGTGWQYIDYTYTATS